MKKEAGFTLLEILIALALTSLLIASLYGIFSTTSEAKQSVEKQGAALHLGRVLIARLDRELLGLSLETGSVVPILTGGENSLGEPYIELLTSSSGGQNPGMRYVQYRLGRDNDNRMTLWRAEKGLYSQTSAREERLAQGIEDLAFSFYDGSNWRKSWDTRSDGRPLLVRAEIKLQDAKDRPLLLSVFNLPYNRGI